MSTGSLAELTRAWIEQDPDEQTKAELQQLLDREQWSELYERMNAPLAFGTAGLRGIVGAGRARMNRAVVLQTARGIAEWLLADVTDARVLPVVVGFDARSSSRDFAERICAVLAAANLNVRYFADPVPTPLVGYAVKQLGAVAGVVVTASHNPAEYNGIKVYGPNAAQIAPPLDERIARFIAAAGRADEIPATHDGFGSAEVIESALFERYLMELDAIRPQSARAPIRIVYTPLHGVGFRFAGRALKYAGHEHVHGVTEQIEPDGSFPTVAFPNPEEPGALDLAFAHAERENADLVLANDPDADRLAVAVPSPAGRWRALTGNEVGVLLADYLLRSAGRSPQPLVVSSIVSSPMLASIAAKYGALWEQTLTGFKWIWACALDLPTRAPLRFVFGYEEALGYSIGHTVRDKDGISAAVLFADLAAACRAEGQSVRERLYALYREHGLWVSVQKSVVRPGTQGAQEIHHAMTRLRRAPPGQLVNRQVLNVRDYSKDAAQRPLWLSSTDMVGLDLEDGGRVLVRPSGTEPKLKVYVDVRLSLQGSSRVETCEEQAYEEARALADAAVHALALTEVTPQEPE